MLRVNALEILIFTSWLLISSEHFQVINIFVKKLHSNLHTCIKNMTEENKKLWISFYIFSIRVLVKAKKIGFFFIKVLRERHGSTWHKNCILFLLFYKMTKTFWRDVSAIHHESPSSPQGTGWRTPRTQTLFITGPQNTLQHITMTIISKKHRLG